MLRSVLVLLFFFCFTQNLSAQLDTFFIKKIPLRLLVSPTFTFQNFKVSFGTNDSSPVFFQTQNIGIGVRIKYKKFGLGVSFPIRHFKSSTVQHPETYALHFDLYPKKLFIQTSVKYFTGLRNVNVDKLLPTDIFQSNNKMYFFDVNAYRLFNGNVSLKSAFKMEEEQQHSAGSLLVGGVLNFQSFFTDSLFLLRDAQGDFQLNQYRSYLVGGGAGYAYAHVWKKWTFTSVMLGGAEVRRLFYNNREENDKRNRILASPLIRIFGSIVYNQKKRYFGVTGFFLPGLGLGNGLNTRVQDWRIRFWVGWRFR